MTQGLRGAARGAPGLFVTGTDTGVGKTLVACALVRGLRARGLDVAAMKPVETGVGVEGPQDALALWEAAGGTDSLEDVCPARFALGAAPSVAAAAEGRRVDLEGVRAAFDRLARDRDGIVVEGAGGLLVPITADLTMADLAAGLGLPLLVVCRGALGTINHTRLTVETARARGLGVAGLVISHGGQPLDPADAANLEALREQPGTPLLGEIPRLEVGASVPSASLQLDAIAKLLV